MTTIQHAARRLMNTPDWSWRHELPATPAERAAALHLRSLRDRAAHWLELASEAIGLALPTGNGSGGPWQRSAVLDANHRVGILDVAHGTIHWTDAVAPSYVRRFAVATKRAGTPNEAGGSGAMGTAIAQVVIVYGMRDAAKPLVRVAALKVTSIEWGLTTCYDYVGKAPKSVPSGAELIETPVPQWDRVAPPGGHLTVELANKVLQSGHWLGGRAEVREGGRHYSGVRGEAEWRVLGTRAEREKLAATVLERHATVAAKYVALMTARARCDAGIATAADRDLVNQSR